MIIQGIHHNCTQVKLDLKIHYEGKPVTPIPDDIGIKKSSSVKVI